MVFLVYTQDVVFLVCNQDEFAMFLFELCSLWCGPSINLRAYLLFLNTLFINITEAQNK